MPQQEPVPSGNQPAPQPTPPAAVPNAPFDPVDDALVREIEEFRDDCRRRYKFNNRWDIVLSVLGILLSIAVVAAGFLKRPEISAILGALVGAVVTAQKAFPFGQRAIFYRLLIGQSDNLITRARYHQYDKKEAISTLVTLRMDFAQQLPRGSTAQGSDTKPKPHDPPSGARNH